MDTFPNIKYLTSFQEKNIKILNKKESSAGYPMVRPSSTINKKSFDLSFQNVTSDDKDILDSFFNSHQGEQFQIENLDPLRNDIFVVIFFQDSLDWQYTQGKTNPWNVNITLREI